MNQWLTRAIGVAVLTAGAVALYAQKSSGTTPAPTTPTQMAAHQVSRLTKLLDLTPAQQAAATTAFTAEATTMQGLHEAFQTAHTNLKTAIQNNDAQGIQAASVQLGNLTQQQTAAHATAQAALYSTLTAEQQSKLGALEMMGGPGGPGGHGHGGPGSADVHGGPPLE